jgi:hypothetical protein
VSSQASRIRRDAPLSPCRNGITKTLIPILPRPCLRVYRRDSMASVGLEVINVRCDSSQNEAELGVAQAVCAISDSEIAGDEATRRARAEAVESLLLRGATRRALITAVVGGFVFPPGGTG